MQPENTYAELPQPKHVMHRTTPTRNTYAELPLPENFMLRTPPTSNLRVGRPWVAVASSDDRS
ncbi:hypothetical protein J6590_080665 [Homalodisca vitripennis]|nr:hypothetical protein J6590_080665 [Homalodisca vitripennis]